MGWLAPVIAALVVVSPGAHSAVAAAPNPVPRQEEKATISVIPGTMKAAPGQTFPIAVVLDLESHWHVNTNRPEVPKALGDSEDFIPTTVSASSSDGRLTIQASATQWPAPTMTSASTRDGMVEYGVYEGRVIIYLPVLVARDATPGHADLTVKVGYQACNDQVCLAPVERSFPVKIAVDASAAGWPTDGIYPEIFTGVDRAKLPSVASVSTADDGTTPNGDGDEGGMSGLTVSMIVAGAALLAILVAFIVIKKVL